MKPLPPGQQLVAPGKWPQVGERAPLPGHERQPLRVHGAVASARSWSLEELRELKQETRRVDIHCVTRWSLPDATFSGVPLAALLAHSVPGRDARFVSFIAHSVRQHSTSLPLADALRLDVLIALDFCGQPLTVEHGGPIRAVTPGRYFYKSVKWLAAIELLAEERLGFWEATAGYHNHADPWREERYVASGLSRQEVARILASRDVSHRNLLGLDGSERDLNGLIAHHALLRNANFRRARLVGARFEYANLSNAHFEEAHLRNACFRGADLEGASFLGSDLRHADLRGASLFGATFVESAADRLPRGEGQDRENAPLVMTAILDNSTRIDRSALDVLAPAQAKFVASLVTFDDEHPGDRA